MEKEEQKPVTQTEEKTEGTVTETVEKTEKAEKAEIKTFTQEEVNAMLTKERKKMPSKEELQEFSNWKESQKTAEQKQAEKETEYKKTLSEKESLVQENLVLKSGVNIDDVDYVVFKVSKKEGDFEENLQEFLKENPKYLKKEETEGIEQKATGTPVKTISSKESGVMAILKAKYPEIYK